MFISFRETLFSRVRTLNYKMNIKILPVCVHTSPKLSFSTITITITENNFSNNCKMHGHNELKTAALRELSTSMPEQHPSTVHQAQADMPVPAGPAVDTGPGSYGLKSYYVTFTELMSRIPRTDHTKPYAEHNTLNNQRTGFHIQYIQIFLTQ